MIHYCKPNQIKIYHNIYGKLPEEIKRETGCTTIFNGVLFNSDGTLCCDNRFDGVTKSNDQYTYFGYGWNKKDIPVMVSSANMESYDNFISCVCAIQNGTPQTVNDNDSGIGGKRGRMAFGFKPDGSMIILATSDAGEPLKLSQARDKLFGLSCTNALILDGGGSVYLDSPSGKVDTTEKRKRANRTYICLWEDMPQKKFKVCLDPGHGTGEPNCSPDKRYFEYQMAWDLANRVKNLLEQTECFDVRLTKTDEGATPGLATRASIANMYGADIFVSLHSNAVSGGWYDKTYGLTAWIYAAGGKRQQLAERLLEQFAEQGVELFGSKLYTSNFTVLGKTNMPAVLIENYFHTCHSDVEKLLNNDERDKLAYATACGICEYFNLGADIIPLTEDEEKIEEKVKADIIYRVQTGAFTDENNALAMAQELQKQGYTTIIKEEKR